MHGARSTGENGGGGSMSGIGLGVVNPEIGRKHGSGGSSMLILGGEVDLFNAGRRRGVSDEEGISGTGTAGGARFGFGVLARLRFGELLEARLFRVMGVGLGVLYCSPSTEVEVVESRE